METPSPSDSGRAERPFETSFEGWKPDRHGLLRDRGRGLSKLPLRDGNIWTLRIFSSRGSTFETSFEGWKPRPDVQHLFLDFLSKLPLRDGNKVLSSHRDYVRDFRNFL